MDVLVNACIRHSNKTRYYSFTGIQNIQLSDATVAKEKNFDIKLIAQAQKLKMAKWLRLYCLSL